MSLIESKGIGAVTFLLLMGLTVSRAQSQIIITAIDQFNTGPTLSVNTTTPTAYAAQMNTEAIGGFRDITLTQTGGLGVTSFGFFIPGAISLGTLITTATVTLVYDGSNNSMRGQTNISYNGLGSQNFLTGGANALAVTAGSDLGSTLVVTLYSSPTNYSTSTLMVPAGTNAVNSAGLTPLYMNYNSFFPSAGAGGGVDFSSVGAVELTINDALLDADTSIGIFGTSINPAVPEPGAVALFVGLGITSLFALSRRRRA